MAKTILMYEFSLGQRAALETALADCGFRFLAPERSKYGLELGVLMGERRAKRAAVEYNGDGLKQPMLVMHGLSRTEIDLVFDVLKTHGIDLPMKAVTTPANLKWSSLQLYANLMLEVARQKRK